MLLPEHMSGRTERLQAGFLGAPSPRSSRLSQGSFWGSGGAGNGRYRAPGLAEAGPPGPTWSRHFRAAAPTLSDVRPRGVRFAIRAFGVTPFATALVGCGGPPQSAIHASTTERPTPSTTSSGSTPTHC